MMSDELSERDEIEALLLRHPAVEGAALVAAPDALTGERSVAFVVARTPVRPAELRRHLDALGIASYKLPDRFRLVEALPLTPVGKTDKRHLRDLLATEEKATA